MTKNEQSAKRQAALRKRRHEQGLVRLQVWVTQEQKDRVIEMLKGA